MAKGRGRYQHDERRAKREYMSYEDVPLEEYRYNEPEPSNITGKFIKIFLILFLSVAAVIAVMNIDKLTPDNIAHWFQYDVLGKTDGDGYPISFTGSVVETGNFDLIKGVPVYCSDTTLAVLNNNAGKYQENQHSYASPVLSVNGGYGIIYNTDATGYTVFDRDNQIYSSSSTKKIYAADVAANGIYALLTRSDDYLSKLTAYRTDNLEKYEYAFADYYVNTVSLNNNGTRAVLSGMSARNGEMISVIYILDFRQSSYLQKYEFDDVYIYDVKYLDSGNAVAVGDKKACFINVDEGQKTDIDYSSRTLTTYNLKRDYGMLLSLSANPDGRDCNILTVKADGEQKDEIETRDKIISLDIYEEKPAALFADRITSYNFNGKPLGRVSVPLDSKKLCCCDKNAFYVLGKSRISRLETE